MQSQKQKKQLKKMQSQHRRDSIRSMRPCPL